MWFVKVTPQFIRKFVKRVISKIRLLQYFCNNNIYIMWQWYLGIGSSTRSIKSVFSISEYYFSLLLNGRLKSLEFYESHCHMLRKSASNSEWKWKKYIDKPRFKVKVMLLLQYNRNTSFIYHIKEMMNAVTLQVTSNVLIDKLYIRCMYVDIQGMVLGL